jgi:hypothetical protein
MTDERTSMDYAAYDAYEAVGAPSAAEGVSSRSPWRGSSGRR